MILKLRSNFTDYGGFRGRGPLGEGGSGKAVGFVAWGKAFPLLSLDFINSKGYNSQNEAELYGEVQKLLFELSRYGTNIFY
jgi:hypothetical protein